MQPVPARNAVRQPPARGLIRPLAPRDRIEVRDHLLRLDAAGRRRRFAGSVGDAFVERYARTVAGPLSHARGLFVDGVLRGLGEARFLDASRAEAELAFSLELEFRGRGKGSRLFASLLDAAANRGASRLVFQCQGDNGPMQRIGRRFGAALTAQGGEVTARLAGVADEASLAREAGEARLWRIAAAADRGVYRLASEAGVDLRRRFA